MANKVILIGGEHHLKELEVSGKRDVIEMYPVFDTYPLTSADNLEPINGTFKTLTYRFCGSTPARVFIFELVKQNEN